MKIRKKNKFLFYVQGLLLHRLPVQNLSKKIAKLKAKLSEEELVLVEKRVAYYNRLNLPKKRLLNHTKVSDLLKPKTPKAYYFDTYEYARFFDKNHPLDFVFGDVTHIPDSPSIVKSRPISNDNENSVLLNLDKARHFVFVKDPYPFREKENLLIGRCAIFQEHRYRFFEKYFGHRLCNLAQVNEKGGNIDWYQPKISIKDHLKYKFILSLQGNDVATNLKWIMSSNSIAVMPKPTLETWFMEGTLEGGKHYIEIKPDYSDLEEKLLYYIENENLCMEILKNQHQYIAQFQNPQIEDLCSLLVLQKYFDTTTS